MDEDYVPPPLPPPPSAEPVAAHLSVKAPAFDEVSAARWFKIMESNFVLAKITASATKFHHILSSLPVDVTNKLSEDVIDSNDYDNIKSSVIALYSKSAPELFDALLSQNNIMCSKPTLFLQEIRKLASQMNLNDDFLKIKFLKALPNHVRMSLVTYNSDNLEELARVADTLLAYNNPYSFQPNQVSAIHSSSKYNNASSNFSHPDNTRNPTYQNSRPFHSPSSSNSTPSQYSSSSVPQGVRAFHHKQRPQVCRFHIYYGSNARSCKSWCILSSSSSNILPDSRPSSRSSSPQPPSRSTVN